MSKDNNHDGEGGNALTFSSLEMEIFSTGKWNNDEYTEKDLDNMVEAYNEIGAEVQPYLKLGHNQEQQLAKNSGLFKDGMPAMGWVESIKKVGNKLFAKFKDVPREIAELVKRKAYRHVSSEIYINYMHNGKKFPFALKAVALLGADMPAVTNLGDVFALYKEDDGIHEIKTVEFDQEKNEEVGLIMDPKEKEALELKFKEEKDALVKEYEDKIVATKELEAKFAEEKTVLEAKFAEEKEVATANALKEFEAQKEKVEALLEVFKSEGEDVLSVAKDLLAQRKDTAEKAKLYTDSIEKQKKAEVSEYVESLVKSNQLLPMQREMATQLLFNLVDDTRELTFSKSKEYGIEEKKSLGETLKAFMSAYPDMGLLKEFSSTKTEEQFSSKEDEFDALVAKYMKDNPTVDFGQAQVAIQKIRPELVS